MPNDSRSSPILRLDPWAAEYEGSILISEEEEGASVDVRVELEEWGPITPAAALPLRRIAFVDGVRRVEHRLLVTHPASAAEGRSTARTVPGLLGSFGVGAALVEDGARVACESIGRVLVTTGGSRLAPFVARLPDRRSALRFEPWSEAATKPAAPVEGLQAAMREAEARLAERLAGEGDVVFQDGPLSLVSSGARGALVGFVKRLQRQYLDAAEHGLLARLGIGQRTPLFLVGGRQPRYSWYQRIAFGRAIEAALTGVVRLETLAGVGLDETRRLADISAALLPRFASDAARDPRAPQNLHPIGGLEARLKHLLGDATLVRRAIEAELHGELAA